jgi:hypothetical protein
VSRWTAPDTCVFAFLQLVQAFRIIDVVTLRLLIDGVYVGSTELTPPEESDCFKGPVACLRTMAVGTEFANGRDFSYYQWDSEAGRYINSRYDAGV